MSFEDLKVRAAMFFGESVHQPETLHELQELLREQVSALQITGQQVPEDLLQLEVRLEEALSAGGKNLLNDADKKQVETGD